MSTLRKLSLVAVAVSAVLSVQAATYTFTPNDNNADGTGDNDDMLDLDHYKYFTWGFKNFVVPAGQQIVSAKLTIYNVNNWTESENEQIVYKKDSRGRYIYVNGQKVVDYIIPAKNWLNIWLLDGLKSDYMGTVNMDPNTTSGKSGKLTAIGDQDGSSDIFASWTSTSTNTTINPYNPAEGPSSGLQAVKIATYSDKKGGESHDSYVADVVTLNYDFGTLGVLDDLQRYIDSGNNFGIGLDPDCHFWNTGVKLVICTAPIPVNTPDAGSSLGLLGIGMGLLAFVRRRLRR